MGPDFKAFAAPLLAAVFGAALIPGAALASGDVGEHVQTYWEHLDEYAQGVQRMNATLDDLVRQARAGKFDVSDVDGLIAVWEDVKVHGAIEVVATPLYPGVWQGIFALRKAAEQPSVEAVAAAAEQTSAALHEGLGALKFAAYRRDASAPQQSAAPAADDPIRAIEERLNRAVSEYQEGHAEDAKKLIHDAYFNYFEGIEGPLIEQDPQLVTGLEEDFNAVLPGLMTQGAPVSEVRQQVEVMLEKLHRAEELLAQAEADKGKVF